MRSNISLLLTSRYLKGSALIIETLLEHIAWHNKYNIGVIYMYLLHSAYVFYNFGLLD